MKDVMIWMDRTPELTAEIPFPFTEEEFADGLVKIRCFSSMTDIKNIRYRFLATYPDNNQFKILELYRGHEPLVYLNLMFLLEDKKPDWDFQKTLFYNYQVGTNSMLEFASVLCNVEDSYIYTYEYSTSGEYAETRLGKEIVGMSDESVPEWLENYVDYYSLGESYGDPYYYDDEFYAEADYIGVDENYYNDWETLADNELNTEWDFEFFFTYLDELKEKQNVKIISTTDEILDFLEARA